MESFDKIEKEVNILYTKIMRGKWSWFVYIVKCKDDSYYVGRTSDIAKREHEHRQGFGAQYTREHGFVEVVHVERYEDFDMARQRELQLKGWTRMKKEKLISGEWTQDIG